MIVWDDYNNAMLSDLVFDSNMSLLEIARELETTEMDVKRQMRILGLHWVKRSDHHVSRGQSALTDVLRKLLPGQKIVNEEHIGDRLRLDVYCPAYKLAIEYHGRQHFYYIEHFHGNMDGFYESQRRDQKKIDLCKDLGITLIVFRFSDSLKEVDVYERVLEALRNAPETAAKEDSKGQVRDRGPRYDVWLQRQREYRRQSYIKMKQMRRV